MKKFLLQISVVLILNLCVLAQNDNLPRIVDEFGKINAEDLEARLDAFSSAIRSNPKFAGRVIIYRGENSTFGFPIRYGVRIQTSLLNAIGIKANRLEITNCGTGQSDLVQLILVPLDYKSMSVPGLPCNDIDNLPNQKQTFLFDRFWYQLPKEISSCCVVDDYGSIEKTASLDAFAARLKENETLKAVLIFYSYKCLKREVCKYQPSDSSKLENIILKREKDYLIKRHNISPLRIITINGGFKRGEYSAEARNLELWLVPKNGEIPKPKPDYFPKKSKNKSE